MPCTPNSHRLLLVTALCLLITSLFAQQKRRPRIDCTRFVFAPACRGVSAKRALDPRAVTLDENVAPSFSDLDDEILRSFLAYNRHKQQEQAAPRPDAPSSLLRLVAQRGLRHRTPHSLHRPVPWSVEQSFLKTGSDGALSWPNSIKSLQED
ncbi:abdominal ganglion neuropeptide L11 precursor [Aplysia californica]|uniref:Abdominal ganglion neuropeptide L11 n=1 Tax=Aplysia californica TaxID=6500 RepID=AGN1_APLCA|nr:abdominal ganglion neuropeptide L11 precursor [Aplysia californica]P06518.1 RecName: Full=Abdominal ganglion neuropeptide L11; Flags: Precursor [Aplysia californica]AAA27762.1 L11 neuropeptide precursor [Aplysia californica]